MISPKRREERKMEILLYLLLIGFIVWLVYLFIVYIIAPMSGLIFTVFSTIVLGYAFYTTTRSFITSVVHNRNPYTTYVDKSSNAPPGARRNYFFGPGYHQVINIVKEAYDLQSGYIAKLGIWKDKYSDKPWYLYIWILLCFIVAAFCTLFLGLAWLAIFSLVLFSVLVTGMSVFYIFFALLWGIDRLYLVLKSISSRCLNCKRTAIVPVFECPTCGMKHKKLTPGPYGVLKRKCACGAKLPTTLFNGRSKLQASCPYCEVEMAASDAHQFGIQLVGGMSAGKTTFLASFWHHYLKATSEVKDLETKRVPEETFDELDYWFDRGLSVSTAETNANMYSVIHRLPEKTPLQFAFYDIAGEAFTQLDGNIQQQQFQYCEGVILVADPTAPIELTENAFIGFLNTFKALKGKGSTKFSNLPLAVIISKADLFKKEIGLVKIKAEHAKNALAYADEDGNTSLARTRDGLCRTFLEDHGFGNVVNLIDSEFKTVSIFPVSAIGHEAEEGKAYEPWGVMQSAFWIFMQADQQSRDYFAPVASIAEKYCGEGLVL